MRSGTFYSLLTILNCLFGSLTVQSQVQKLYINPKTIAREKQTKFIDSIRFIPLELKEGVGLGNNYNVNVTAGNILLTDYINKALLVFSKQGKFIKNISFKKLGPNFYPGYSELTNQITFFGNNKHYTLTPKDLIKIKLDWSNPRNKKYFKKYVIDLKDPSFTIKKSVPDEKDIVNVRPFYDDYFVQGSISVSPLYKDSLDHEIKLYKNNELVSAYFPYNRINEPRFLFTQENTGIHKTLKEDIHFITRPYYDTVYKMIKDSVFPAYKLVMPLENTIPASFYTKPFKNNTERDNFNRNNGWMMRQIQSFYETPRFIFFMIGYLSNFDSYIYEKQTNTTFKTKNIRPDSTHYNLQLFPTFGMTRIADKFYKPQQAGELITFFDKNKNAAVPKELEEFIKSKPPASTPVIVEFKLKN